MSDKLGRPRDIALDAAIAAATESVLLAEGYAAVSIDRVAKIAGTTRATVYRRVKSRGELVVGLLIHRFGTSPAPDTGDLRQDIGHVQELQRIFFADAVVRAGLAGLLSDTYAEPTLAAVLFDRFLAPRRQSVAAMLSRAAARGQIVPVDDPARISDILTGPLLFRALVPAIGPIDDALVETTIKAALNAVSAG
ncbi:MAG TPA: TetR/AcrR family transcriptional regulator C-terminal ligand-binding domain-containing protein [Mycobacterium sp.]|nr:TetR/AcrR family transcriptional regulator C-terminal ligand-binding domain-containing protein [Mycobacterium sp.]